MKELICIVCPKGCHLKVDEENGYAVTGNTCLKGAEYGKNELLNPMRVVTSTVRAEGGAYQRCSDKTAGSIPKEKIFEVMEALNSVTLKAPVKTGDIVIKDVCGTGVDVVATRSL